MEFISGQKLTAAQLNAAFGEKLDAVIYPLNFASASDDPTANDDSANTSGNGVFARNSTWINLASQEAYRCLNASPTSAVWVKTTLTTDELGPAAVAAFSTQAQAEAGTDAATVMSPLRVAQAVSALGTVPSRLGPAAPTVTNYNDATQNGFYQAASGATNQPAAINALIEVIAADANNLIQIAMDRASSSIYYRRKAGGTFGAWETVCWTQADQDTRYPQRAKNLSDLADAPAAFGNIKQAASTGATGVVELATDDETQTGTDTVRAITPANLTAKQATAAQIRSNTSNLILTTDKVISAGAWVTLTYSATISPDLSAGFDFTTTLTGAATLGTMTNKKDQSGLIEVKQDATGGRTLGFSSDYVTPGGTPSIDTGASKRNFFSYRVLSDSKVLLMYLGSSS